MIFMTADMIEEHHFKKVHVHEHEGVKTRLQELVSIPLLVYLIDFDLFRIDGSGLKEDLAMKDVSTTRDETLLT